MSLRSVFTRIVEQPRSWLRAVLQRNRLEAEMEAELSCHLDALTADLIRAGHSPREAARRARIALGAATVHKEGMRASLGLRWWDEFWADVRYGLRMLRKSPGFTAIAATSLALAIGANTTIFSIAKSLLYDRLGVEHPERLRIVGWNGDKHVVAHSWWSSFNAEAAGMKNECFSYPVFLEIQARARQTGELIAFKGVRLNAKIGGKPRLMDMELVSGNYFPVLGARPQLGRVLGPSDAEGAGKSPVAVISDGLWQSEFGRSPAVLGQTLTLGKSVLTIVGVSPRGFTGAQSVQVSPDLWVPVTMQPLVDPMPGRVQLLDDATNWWLEVMDRLKPGVTDTAARAELDVALTTAVHGVMTVEAGDTMPTSALADGSRGLHQLDTEFRKPVNVLLVLVGLVLLLACANIANLLLARGAQRQREMSVRLALGAGRGRVLRQLLTESLLLSGIGGAAGLLLGYVGRNVLPGLLADPPHRNGLTIHFDWGVFAFTAGVTLVTGLLFGLAPAWTAARAEVTSSLKEGAQTATRRRRGLGGKALVGFQVALSTLLVIGAGLFLRTVIGLTSVDMGYRTDHLLLAELATPMARYPDKKSVALHQRLEQAIAAVPGVESVTAMTVRYLGGSMSYGFVTQEESDERKKGEAEMVNVVGNQFFPVLGIPMVAGRGFGPQETATSPKVAVINQSLAHKRFAHANPVGQRFRRGGAGSDWIQVVGVCGDTRYESLRDDPPPQFFLPYVQEQRVWSMDYAIRTHLAAAQIVPALQRAVAQIDGDIPLQYVLTQQQDIDESLRTERALASLTAGFGVLALALACVGIYGIMAYSVANRRNEIGIRLALGAQPGQVRGMILRESTWLAVAGIVAGVGASLGLMRLVKSMLYGIQPYDPLSMLAGAAILLVVALAASWIPARRAAGVQPMEALRHE